MCPQIPASSRTCTGLPGANPPPGPGGPKRGPGGPEVVLFGGPRGCMLGPMPGAPGPLASPFDRGGRKPAAQHDKSSCSSNERH